MTDLLGISDAGGVSLSGSPIAYRTLTGHAAGVASLEGLVVRNVTLSGVLNRSATLSGRWEGVTKSGGFDLRFAQNLLNYLLFFGR